MKILMLKTESGSVDGIRVSTYFAGEEYDLSDSPGARALAAAFIGAGLAEEVKESEVRPLVGESTGPGDQVPESEVQPADKPVNPANNKRQGRK